MDILVRKAASGIPGHSVCLEELVTQNKMYRISGGRKGFYW